MNSDGLVPVQRHPGDPFEFSPREINVLARMIAERESLRTQDLPRTRREIRLQLRYAGWNGPVLDKAASSTRPDQNARSHRRPRRPTTAPRATTTFQEDAIGAGGA